MRVTLINWTGKGAKKYSVKYGNPCYEDDTNGEAAVDQLLFTKATRLTMSPGLLEEISQWPWEKKLAELDYISKTIPSSHEFVDYTFMIEGVSRGFTHQFVRSRQFSFAQQTMRVLDVSTGPGWDYHAGPSFFNPTEEAARASLRYQKTMDAIDETYKANIADGIAIEDARGILPTNILTNIVGKCNMRTFVELVRKRSSPRTQSEYRDVLEAMKAAVRAVHPWIDLFIDRTFDRAANELCEELKRLIDAQEREHISQGDVEHLNKDTATRLIKLVDQMRGQS